MSAKRPSGVGWWRPVVLVATVAALGALAQSLDVAQHLVALREEPETLGLRGSMLFALGYVIAVVAAVPGSALTAATGALFGSVLGVVIASTAATVGASLSFLIARYFARNAMSRWLSGNEKLRRLDDLIARYGAIAVLLTRLSPFLPFNLVNYGFGLTRIRFWTYVFWSWIGMLPGVVFVVVASDVVVQAMIRGQIPWLLLCISLLAGITGTILFVYVRKRLRTS